MTNVPEQRPDLVDTQPHRSQDRRLHSGCFYGALFAVLVPLFLCGALITVYLVFPPAPLNVVVMGLDSREGEGAATRTDSIILVGVDPTHFRVSLLSIPRDLFIDTPGY